MKYAILAILAVALVLAACGGNTQNTDDQLPNFDDAEPKEPSAADVAAEKLKDLFASGMAVHCTYKMQDQGVEMDVETWATADKSRSEMNFVVNGQTQNTVSIVTEEGAYVKTDDQMAENEMMKDCDWIFYEDAGEGGVDEAPDFDEDYTMEESIAAMQGMYADFDCSPAKPPSGAFTPDGEVCDMESMMEDMLAQMGDMENFDPSMYN